MKKYICTKLIYASLLLLTISGCTEDFLQEDPKGRLTSEGFPANTEQVGQAMSAMYNRASVFCDQAAITTRNCGTEEFTTYFTFNKYYQEYCDDYTMHLKQKDAGEPRDAPIWDGCYGGIKQANWLLKNLDNASININPNSDVKDPKVIELAKGQAYFMRAMLYFNLTRYFGKVPLILVADVNYKPTQLASFKEIYDQIIADLSEAQANLPEFKWDAANLGKTASFLPATWLSNKSLPTQGWVRTLRAQVYLTMAGWPLTPIGENPNAAQQGSDAIEYYKKAAEDAKYVIDNKTKFGYDLEADYKDLWLFEKQTSVKENIITMYYHRDGHDQGLTQALRPRTEPGKPWGGWNDMFIERPYYASYPESYRKKTTFTTAWYTRAAVNKRFWYEYNQFYPSTDLQDTTQLLAGKIDSAYSYWFYSPFLSKFRSNVVFPFDSLFADSPLGDNGIVSERSIVLMRYAHLLFIYAEASTRASWTVSNEALDAVNQIRRRAQKLPANNPNATFDLPSGLTASAFLDSLLMEKSYELVGEPDSRWHDLVRLDEVYEVALKIKAQRATYTKKLSEVKWIRKNVDGKIKLLMAPDAHYMHHDIRDLKDVTIPTDRRLLHYYYAPNAEIQAYPTLFTY